MNSCIPIIMINKPMGVCISIICLCHRIRNGTKMVSSLCGYVEDRSVNAAANLEILSFVQQDKNIIYTVSRTEIYGCGVHLNLRSPVRAVKGYTVKQQDCPVRASSFFN